MKSTFLLHIVLCFFTSHAIGQQALHQTLRKLTDLKPTSIPDSLNLSPEELTDVQTTIKSVQYWAEKKSFSGEARFGFNGVTTRSGENNLFSLYGGIQMDWELYPGSLDFNTLFGVTYTDGELQENVSQIDVSYDHLHTSVADGRFLETYVYMTRATDAYIGIDQRYEVGGGIILNHWIKPAIASETGQFPYPLFGPEGNNLWKPMLRTVTPDLPAEDIKSFKRDYKAAVNKNQMANSKLRMAVLAGLFYELEKATVNDSISLDVSNSFRMTLRPTLDIKLKDGWKLKIRQYIKMPMPWQWQSVVTATDGTEDRRADYRIDLNAAITTQLLSKRVEIGFIYNLTYDHAPPRAWYEGTDGSQTLVVNNDLNQTFRVSLNVRLEK